MRIRVALVIGFVAQVVFMNLCIMPPAAASTLPTPHARPSGPGQAAAKAAGAHCRHCPGEHAAGSPAPESITCADHCLARAADWSIRGVPAGVQESAANPIPMTLHQPAFSTPQIPAADGARVSAVYPIGSVVLRL